MVGLVSNTSPKASAKPQSAEVGKLDLFEEFYSLTTQPAQAGFAILAETKRSLSPTLREAMR
jgi:hypothetical protein